jgi:ankyrin repeat protein
VRCWYISILFQKAIEKHHFDLALRLFPSKGLEPEELLCVAIKKGYIELAFKLIAIEGLEMNRKSKSGDLPLVLAVKHKSINLIRALIHIGADPNSYANAGENAIIAAVNIGSLEIVKLLIELGADISSIDYSNRTLLMLAARINHVPLFKYLASFNSIPLNAVDREGKTVLGHAYRSKELKFIWLILSKGAPVVGSILFFSFSPLAEALSLLLQLGGDPNDRCPRSFITALMNTASRNRVTHMKHLIDNGAQIDAVDKFGQTALIHAAKKGHHMAVELLLNHKADLSISNREGKTALDEALLSRDLQTIKILRSSGAEQGGNNLIRMIHARRINRYLFTR